MHIRGFWGRPRDVGVSHPRAEELNISEGVRRNSPVSFLLSVVGFFFSLQVWPASD